MDCYHIIGQNRLNGKVCLHGAKNSALPILAATILSNKQSVIHNCPQLTDIKAACDILEYIGCTVTRQGQSVVVDPSGICRGDIPDNLMREMRSSIIFLGALAARLGKTCVSFPGGCELGARPIDLHLFGLRKLGLIINEEHGLLDCTAPGRLKGAKIVLSFPSVGATENILLACVLAQGTTTIANAAREPEIIDLANYLNACGAQVRGAGSDTIVVEGVPKLHGAEHSVIPDRIVAATYLAAAAATGGEVLVQDCCPLHLESILPVFEHAGCVVSCTQNSIYLSAKQPLKAVPVIRTLPYPGFPTDAQAPLMAMLSLAQGTSVIVENIFENRFKHVPEMLKMGADIKVEGRVAVVSGVSRLHSAKVYASDLRAGAALVVAALAAQGESEVYGLSHIDRGYENLDTTLQNLGARMIRKYEE